MDIVINQDIEIYNPELKKITGEIQKACINIINNTFKIADLIAKVQKDELYIEDGFSDVFDYAKQAFSLEKSSVYNLIRVGSEYVNTYKDKKGVVSYESVLEHKEKDFTISQIYKVLPLGIDDARELAHDGVIKPDMTCRQIDRIVKNNLKRKDGTDEKPKKVKKKKEPESVLITEDVTQVIKFDTLPDNFKNYLNDNYGSLNSYIIENQ